MANSSMQAHQPFMANSLLAAMHSNKSARVCNNIKAKFEDTNCCSDSYPYVTVKYGRRVFRTQTEIGSCPVYKATFSCEAYPISDIHIELTDRGFFSTSKLSGCRIPFPQVVLHDTNVDAWYTLYRLKNNSTHGKIHLIIRCKTVCPRSIQISSFGALCQHMNEFSIPICCDVVEAHRFQSRIAYCIPNQNLNSRENDFIRLKELFPNMSDNTLNDTYECYGRNFQATANVLAELESPPRKENEVKPEANTGTNSNTL